MEIFEKISYFVLPCVVLLIAVIILFGRKRDYFSAFLEGAGGGIKSAISLLPSMCALIISVSMLTSSGLCDYLCQLLSPVFEFLGIPVELFPLILLRPFSGSASIATYKEIMTKYGADSFAGVCASIIMASSDTFVYVICMYFSASKIKKTRYALPVCLLVSLLCVFLSTIISRLFLNII